MTTTTTEQALTKTELLRLAEKCNLGHLAENDLWIDFRATMENVLKFAAALAATQSAQNSQVDWLGLALDLEQQAKRVESQTVERSMLAAAHGLRLMGAAQSAQPQEPVGEVGKVIMFGGDCKEVSWTKGKMPPVGTKLYAAPVAQAAQQQYDAAARYAAKLEQVWDGIREAVEKYSGKPCEGEPLDRLHELLATLSAHPVQAAQQAREPRVIRNADGELVGIARKSCKPNSEAQQPKGELTDERAAFEEWAKSEGAVNLKPAGDAYCEDFRFPATYYYAATETAWRAWANKPRALLSAQPTAQDSNTTPDGGA